MKEEQYQEIIKLISKNETVPFYCETSFWISTAIGILGLYLSYKAFSEAKEAKKAAKTAGNFVKKQSITIDLTEIIQRLDKLSTDLNYSDTRDFYNELNRRVRRSIATLSTEKDYIDKTKKILDTLNTIKANLESFRQSSSDQSLLAGVNLYNAIEGEFSNLSGKLADLCGLLEQKTLEQ